MRKQRRRFKVRIETQRQDSQDHVSYSSVNVHICVHGTRREVTMRAGYFEMRPRHYSSVVKSLWKGVHDIREIGLSWPPVWLAEANHNERVATLRRSSPFHDPAPVSIELHISLERNQAAIISTSMLLSTLVVCLGLWDQSTAFNAAAPVLIHRHSATATRTRG